MAEADAKEAHAYRPLVTTDPSALPFGSHRVESETQSAYRVPSVRVCACVCARACVCVCGRLLVCSMSMHAKMRLLDALAFL